MADQDTQDLREEKHRLDPTVAHAGYGVSRQAVELDALSDEQAEVEAVELMARIERRLLAEEALTQQLLQRYGLAA
jgi:anti-sigma-K factor RskA